MGGFTLGSKTKETLEMSYQIGQEQGFGPKDFTLEFRVKDMKKWSGDNVSSLSYQISAIPIQGWDANPHVRFQSSIQKYAGLFKGYLKGFWTSRFLDPNPNISMP